MLRPKSFRLSLTRFEKLRLRKKTESSNQDSACNKRWSDLYQTHASACKEASQQSPDKDLSPPPLVEVHPISLVVDLSDCDGASFFSAHTAPPTSSPICCQMYLLRNDMSNSDDLYFLPSPIQICDACDLADIKENLEYAGIRHSALHNWL